MVERTLVMSFRDPGEKKVNITVKDVKENVLDSDVKTLMDSIIAGSLVETSAGALTEIVGAEIVTKDTTEITLN